MLIGVKCLIWQSLRRDDSWALPVGLGEPDDLDLLHDREVFGVDVGDSEDGAPLDGWKGLESLG